MKYYTIHLRKVSIYVIIIMKSQERSNFVSLLLTHHFAVLTKKGFPFLTHEGFNKFILRRGVSLFVRLAGWFQYLGWENVGVAEPKAEAEAISASETV